MVHIRFKPCYRIKFLMKKIDMLNQFSYKYGFTLIDNFRLQLINDALVCHQKRVALLLRCAASSVSALLSRIHTNAYFTELTQVHGIQCHTLTWFVHTCVHVHALIQSHNQSSVEILL